MTPKEWKALQDKASNFEKFKARKADNQAIIDRIKGVPAQPSTPETDADPRNPNEK